MPSITTVAVQSAILKAAANLTAQTLTRWNTQSSSPSPSPYDWTRVAEFAAFGIVSAPLASAWQRLLEDWFPSQRQHRRRSMTQESVADKDETEKSTKTTAQLSWGNILIKLLLDQTIGQFLINLTFLVCTNGARIESWSVLAGEIYARIFGLIWASWKLWPWVALVNFIWVPVQWRVLVGSLVGFGWNIFLSIWSMRR
ncbi:putative peroxisomal membrane protein 2, pxmp2 [Cladophialophora carrionii]|uniref:Putative peroxisomal membrane protein 2, pxmp2 n=1 Tax=Cladophialophora carrionii TaxID=86049 RepID=A0A1C1CGA3_9EURO|nr:putative peroxisomal membrane protein 2, pxmp2 [Cladophialophora carrionii]